MIKNKPLTKQEIESKKEAFSEQIKISSEKAKLGRISPSSEFLFEIKELVKKAIDNDVTYTQIVKDIYSIYNFQIGVQTLRVFCQTQLGVSKKVKSKKTENEFEKKDEFGEMFSQLKG